MFAPLVRTAPTKATACPAAKLTRRGATPVTRPAADRTVEREPGAASMTRRTTPRGVPWNFSRTPLFAPADGRCSCKDGPSRQPAQDLRPGAMTGAPLESGPGRGGAGPSPAADKSPSLPGSPNACVVTATLPSDRSGILRSANGTVGERFEVAVEWQSAPEVGRGDASYCAAECGEYHQFVKGHALSSANEDGHDLTDVSAKLFGGLRLDENQFQEDGLDDNPNARYGHRSEPQTMNEKYEPNRATGTKYTGKDFPNVSIGTFADIDLTFRGDVVDICNQTLTSSKIWRVQYRGKIRP